ncbi:hypothetical protein N7454_010844 [Penicillium verhagenii]|nr:hypothetical protein N7454_010844 [Penicillium verhagenii]
MHALLNQALPLISTNQTRSNNLDRSGPITLAEQGGLFVSEKQAEHRAQARDHSGFAKLMDVQLSQS